MKTIDLFSSLAEHTVNDTRLQRYGLMLLRGTLAEANPVVLWVDAGLSVLDAANAYLNYAANKEITKQLRIETKVLEHNLDLTLRKLKLDHAKLEAHAEDRVTFLIQELDEARLRVSNLAHVISDSIKNLKRLADIIQILREGARTEFSELQGLQDALDLMMQKTLVCIITATNDN